MTTVEEINQQINDKITGISNNLDTIGQEIDRLIAEKKVLSEEIKNADSELEKQELLRKLQTINNQLNDLYTKSESIVQKSKQTGGYRYDNIETKNPRTKNPRTKNPRTRRPRTRRPKTRRPKTRIPKTRRPKTRKRANSGKYNTRRL